MTQPVETSAKAIWSLVMGILGMICVCFLFGIPAVICGHLALRDIRRSDGRVTGDGMAIVGLVMGYLCIAFTLVAAVIIAMRAVPAFHQMKADSKVELCQQGQRDIFEAVENWAAAEQKNPGDPVAVDDIIDRLSDGEQPVCPVNNMTIAIPETVGQHPVCPDPSVSDDHAMAW